MDRKRMMIMDSAYGSDEAFLSSVVEGIKAIYESWTGYIGKGSEDWTEARYRMKYVSDMICFLLRDMWKQSVCY